MSSWRAVLGVGVALSATMAAVATATDGFRAWTTDAARARAVSIAPIDVPQVALLDMHRAPQHVADRTRSTIVDFVYTRCPSLCGTLGSTYQRLQAELQQRGLADRVRLLTVSFDPVWDTPERLRYYAIAMRPDPAIWTIATLPDTSGLASLLGVFGVRVIADGAGGLTHNAALHVVDPAGRLVGIVPIDATADAIDLALSRSDAYAPTGRASTGRASTARSTTVGAR